jgi:hypothetical protein
VESIDNGEGKPFDWAGSGTSRASPRINILSFAENYHRGEEETAMTKNTKYKLLSLAEQRTNNK